MKTKNLLNIMLSISMIIFTGLGIFMVVRNIPFGIAAMLVMAVINALAVILLILAATLKRKLWASICRMLIIGWLIYAFIGASSSANEDATLFAAIYAITGVSAIVFGILRHKTLKACSN